MSLRRRNETGLDPSDAVGVFTCSAWGPPATPSLALLTQLPGNLRWGSGLLLISVPTGSDPGPWGPRKRPHGGCSSVDSGLRCCSGWRGSVFHRVFCQDVEKAPQGSHGSGCLVGEAAICRERHPFG